MYFFFYVFFKSSICSEPCSQGISRRAVKRHNSQPVEVWSPVEVNSLANPGQFALDYKHLCHWLNQLSCGLPRLGHFYNWCQDSVWPLIILVLDFSLFTYVYIRTHYQPWILYHEILFCLWTEQSHLLSEWVPATITKYHGLGALNKYFFLTVLETE